MKVEFEVSDVIPASPDKVYSAWLDSDEHSAMTGGFARITDQVGAILKHGMDILEVKTWS